MIYAISIGTNTGNRIQNLKKAITEINARLGKIEKISSVYESEPWGFESENWFYNMLVVLNASVDPLHLIEKLLEIERSMGRIRNKNGYSDRCIDLDVILCNEFTICSKNIILPHPHMHKRLFVLLPLQELMPQWVHPFFKKNTDELIRICEDKSRIKRIDNYKICFQPEGQKHD